MDLSKYGKFLSNLRKEKGLTQKDVAEKLGIVPKTVSKWETGHGFPDVTTLIELAEILGVSVKSLLSGTLLQNEETSGNINHTKFYVCPDCNSMFQGVGECQVICCGKPLASIKPQAFDDAHAIKISKVENDLYIEFSHEMKKEHYIAFVTYIGFDRVLTIRLYPEQDAAVRIPEVYSGKIVYYCNKHGLFEYPIKTERRNRV